MTSLAAGSDGFVGPKPVPQREMMLPGLAGANVLPVIKPGLPTYLPSGWVAATYSVPSKRKKAGAIGRLSAVKELLVPRGVVTCTCTCPAVVSSGTSTLSWVGLT